jgi:hypothetical protein
LLLPLLPPSRRRVVVLSVRRGWRCDVAAVCYSGGGSHTRTCSKFCKKKYRRGGVELMGYETRRDASRCLLLPPCRRTVTVADTVRSPGHPASVGRSLIKCSNVRLSI